MVTCYFLPKWLLWKSSIKKHTWIWCAGTVYISAQICLQFFQREHDIKTCNSLESKAQNDDLPMTLVSTGIPWWSHRASDKAHHNNAGSLDLSAQSMSAEPCCCCMWELSDESIKNHNGHGAMQQRADKLLPGERSLLEHHPTADKETEIPDKHSDSLLNYKKKEWKPSNHTTKTS